MYFSAVVLDVPSFPPVINLDRRYFGRANGSYVLRRRKGRNDGNGDTRIEIEIGIAIGSRFRSRFRFREASGDKTVERIESGRNKRAQNQQVHGTRYRAPVTSAVMS